MQLFSLHTHTVGFDGQNTEEEMLNQAIRLKLEYIGFSNHFIVHPNIKNSPMFKFAVRGGYDKIYSSDFEEAVAKFEQHYKNIDYLNKYSPIPIYKGMEVDFFNNRLWKDGFNNVIQKLKPDYLIGSNHFIEENDVLYNSHDLKHFDKEKQNKLLLKYWDNVRNSAKSNLFLFLAHLDLMKKLNLGTEESFAKEELKTVETIKENNVLVELNTSAIDKCFEPYPSPRIMKLIAKYNVPVLLSDDAHQKDNLTRHFSKTEKIARECGIKLFQSPFQR